MGYLGGGKVRAIIIKHTEDDVCEQCGKVAELRPYGKNGASICYECGMLDEKETEKNMKRILFGVVEH